jgi:hypothetical protein
MSVCAPQNLNITKHERLAITVRSCQLAHTHFALRFSVLLLFIGLVEGCAPPAIKDPASVSAAAKSCCASLADLPPPSSAEKEHTLQLMPTARHFDFGYGLAPFARFKIGQNIHALEFRAHARYGGARFMGGDDRFHFADVKFAFFDAENQPLTVPSIAPSSLKSMGFSGEYTLVSSIPVPANASTVIVTTNVRSAGQQNSSPVRIAGGGMMLGSTFVAMPGGTPTIAYTLSPYGEVTVLEVP